MGPADLQLTVPARPESLGVVRQAIAGLAESVGMNGSHVADLKTVVTEACNNVVLYAYEDDVGPLEVLATPREDAIEVTVIDRGSGFRPRAPEEQEEASLGLGLPLIAALSDSFELRGGSGRGTEVRMRVEFGQQRSPKQQREPAYPKPEEKQTLVEISPGSLVRPVLARVLGALGARAEFSLDQVADTVLLGDAVSAHSATDFAADRVAVHVSDGDGTMDVRVGPLVEGAGDRLVSGLDVPGPEGASLKRLARRVEVDRQTDERGKAREYLLIEIG
jgi:serine/threonine-protein kinase RsbW